MGEIVIGGTGRRDDLEPESLEERARGLYGLGSPGSIINMTTKRPTATPFGEMQLQIGQYDRYEGNFDVGDPVVGLDQFSYRITGLMRESNSWLPGANDNRTYIAPAVTWRPDQDTSVTVLAEPRRAGLLLRCDEPEAHNGLGRSSREPPLRAQCPQAQHLPIN